MMFDPTQPVKTTFEEVAEPKVVVPVVLKVMLPEPLMVKLVEVAVQTPDVWVYPVILVKAPATVNLSVPPV